MPCPGDQCLKFLVSFSKFALFWTGTSVQEGEHFMEIQRMPAEQWGPFPTSVVMYLCFGFYLLTY
jgi:hypothetical protein